MSVYFVVFHSAPITSSQNFDLKTTTCLFSFVSLVRSPWHFREKTFRILWGNQRYVNKLGVFFVYSCFLSL